MINLHPVSVDDQSSSSSPLFIHVIRYVSGEQVDVLQKEIKRVVFSSFIKGKKRKKMEGKQEEKGRKLFPSKSEGNGRKERERKRGEEEKRKEKK
ncbi:hypothetical protein QVD17_07221 [Tagetes erecta]|uniref:Uncharacterized protein n=1 Tax=Tagetes erecta TaxID=13708 RepID=A0AAD8LMB2_TARER|nr:hypothetical protein QVD17_07221 [Tagetes erecta]